VIGSDHAPYSVEEKEQGNIFKACAGFPTMEFRFPLMFTKMLAGKLSLQKLVDLLSRNPARIFDIYPKKGTLSIGSDADLIIVDAEKKYKLTMDSMQSKSRRAAKIFENIEVAGEIVSTMVRGNFVKENGAMVAGQKGTGQILKPLGSHSTRCQV
jgi:dihydropyrimidinase/allantoinase